MEAGRRLDALVAENVFGCHVERRGKEEDWFINNPMPIRALPHYSTDIKEAWAVFCKFPSRYLSFDDATDTWFCSLDTHRRVQEDCRYQASSEDETGAEAICLCALKAVGIDIAHE